MAPTGARDGPATNAAVASALLTAAGAGSWRRRWDRQQSRLLPRREERFAVMLEALRAGAGPRFRFLDLGAGTGSLSERILARFPRARGIAVDFDPVILRIGRIGLGDRGGRLRWVEADLRRRDWAKGLPARRYDAAVSSTALHWLTGPQLTHLYAELHRRLRPSGLFLDADGIAFAPEHTTLRRTAHESARGERRGSPRRAGESWEAWWLAVERDPRFTREIALRRQRFPHAHSATPTPDLAGHVRRLRAAGFREVEVIWSRWQDRVLAAVR